MEPFNIMLLLLAMILPFILYHLMFHSLCVTHKIVPRYDWRTRHANLRENESSEGQMSWTLSYERRNVCNIHHQASCYTTNKSLVLTFWSEKSNSRWLPDHLISAFPFHSFDHMIFVYDNSSWHSHSDYERFIFIHVQGQIRF